MINGQHVLGELVHQEIRVDEEETHVSYITAGPLWGELSLQWCKDVAVCQQLVTNLSA